MTPNDKQIEEIKKELERGRGSHVQKEHIRFLLSEIDRLRGESKYCPECVKSGEKIKSIEGKVHRLRESLGVALVDQRHCMDKLYSKYEWHDVDLWARFRTNQQALQETEGEEKQVVHSCCNKHKKHDPNCWFCNVMVGGFTMSQDERDARAKHYLESIGLYSENKKPSREDERLKAMEAVVRIARKLYENSTCVIDEIACPKCGMLEALCRLDELKESE